MHTGFKIMLTATPHPPFSVCIADKGLTGAGGVCIANAGLKVAHFQILTRRALSRWIFRSGRKGEIQFALMK